MSVDPPIKWHGGKHYLAPKIVALMPPRCQNPNKPDPDDAGWLHYVEPYAGGLAVLLAIDPEGISEVANDLNRELTGFWTVLANPKLFDFFHRAVTMTPFSRVEYEDAARNLDGNRPWEAFDGVGGEAVARAAWFFVRCRQSLSGRMDGFAGITRNRTRRGMNEQVSAWLNAIEGLPAVHERLKRVLILNRDALDVIRSEDGPRTLFYLDPPYLHETRATTGEYAHEMTEEAHRNLLHQLGGIEGRFLLSGYQSPLYESFARRNRWHRTDFDLPNNAAGGKAKRRMVECVWTNYRPAPSSPQ